MERSVIDYDEVGEAAVKQLNALRQTLEYVGVNSPFYQKMFEEMQFNVQDFTSISMLERLPFTNKENLQLSNRDFLAVPPGQIAEYVTTSGTLGDPVTFMLTEGDLDRLAYNEARGLAVAGIHKGDVVQITTTLDRRFMAGLAYYLGCRKIGAATIRAGIGLPQMQCDIIRQMHPTVLIGVPSFIVKLIEYAHQHNIDLNAFSVKKIICIGERIREIDFSPNRVGQYILQHWNVQLFSTYASTEMATAFTECAAGRGGHQLNELIYTEVVDEDGHAVPDGTPGELVITTLKTKGMPLVRFKTGDIVFQETNVCACGRTSKRLSPVIGRKGQMIKYKGTTLFPASIQHILDHVTEIDTYIIEVVSNEFGEDDLQLLIAIKGHESEIIRRIEELCKSHLRVTPKVLIRNAEFINHLRNRPELRKPMIFIDNRLKSV